MVMRFILGVTGSVKKSWGSKHEYSETHTKVTAREEVTRCNHRCALENETVCESIMKRVYVLLHTH